MNTHFTLSLEWTYPQRKTKCCPPIRRGLEKFPVPKIHIFHLINKRCTVMAGWYRTLSGGYLQSMEQILQLNAHYELGFPFSYDAFFILTSSGVQHFFNPGPTKLQRFSATLSHILQFTFESITNRPPQPLWCHCWKLRGCNGVRWWSIKILFGYFIGHTTNLVYYYQQLLLLEIKFSLPTNKDVRCKIHTTCLFAVFPDCFV